MSLFGDEEPTSKPGQSSLFNDGPASPNSKQPAGGGLFADDNIDSPWGIPTPKKQARAGLIRSLIPPDSVPELYIEAFDALLDGGHASGAGISIGGVHELLRGSGLSSEEQTRLLKIVTPDGEPSQLGRAELNVLLALIGLSQEGEEATLDGVDERRRKLPIPKLSDVAVKKQRPDPVVGQTPSTPQTQPAPRTSTPSTHQSINKPSGYSLPESDDPWGSPGKTRTAALAAPNGSSNGMLSGAMPPRTTSAFTTADDEPADESSSLIQGSTAEAAGGWSGYTTSGDGYGGSDLTGGGVFGSSNGHEEVGSSASRQTQHRPARQVSQGAEETVTITALAEKEGTFLFQYRNYEVSSSRRGSKVIRRYSDFVWLLDCLHKRYPFRQLPLLPPKRVAINGNHIAADTQFIEKRRRGLARFANALVRHPVLSQDQLVVMFLTVPTELAAWRKQASISVTEEFVGKVLPPTLEDSLPPSLDDLFDTVRQGIRRSAELYITLCSILERVSKRREGLSADYLRFSNTLHALTDVSADTYHMDTNDVPMLNEGINSTAKHIAQHQGLLEDEARAWDEGVLEDFKMQRDALVGMRDMFDRKDKLARDNIPQLEKRIQTNENKLSAVRAKPDRKAGEAEKLEEAIMKDKESIVNQHARSVFTRECLRDEIKNFQNSQYHVSRTHQDWSQERVKYAELMTDNWRGLLEQVDSMPLGGD